MSDSVLPCGLEPPRLLCPWDSPGKNTGVVPFPSPVVVHREQFCCSLLPHLELWAFSKAWRQFGCHCGSMILASLDKGHGYGCPSSDAQARTCTSQGDGVLTPKGDWCHQLLKASKFIVLKSEDATHSYVHNLKNTISKPQMWWFLAPFLG